MDEHVPLSEHTTFKIGGPARYFFRVKSVEEAREAVLFAREKGLPFFVLGGGSNLLVGDEGFSGVVIKNEMFGISFEEQGEEVRAQVGAGENWDSFVAECVRRNLYGVENLSGIPGTAGAAPIQNIGAYGAEVNDVIDSVEALDSGGGEVKVFRNTDCRFAYRDSFFKTTEGKNYIIISATFRLKKNGVLNLEYKDLKNYFETQKVMPSLGDVRKAVLEIRSGKFPDLNTTGTAGSFFKNPIIPQSQYDELKKLFPDLPGFPLHVTRYTSHDVKIPLAWILDHILHLKGFATSGAGLHDAQPLVIVNRGGASAAAVRRLASDIAAKVKSATGITIEWEVQML